MELHDEAVLRGQPRHLHQHVRFVATLVVRRRVAVACTLEQPLRLFGRELGRVRLHDSVISCRRTERREIPSTSGQCSHECFAACDRLTAHRLERTHLRRPRGQ